MKKFSVVSLIIFFSFTSFGQKKKELIKEITKLKLQATEINAKLAEFEKAEKLDLQDSVQKFSYAYGLNIGSKLKKGGIDAISYNAFTLALEDVFIGNEKMNIEDGEEYISRVLKKIEDAENKARNEEGIKFLAENTKRAEIVTTKSGLQYEILKESDGITPVATDKVKVHYTGMLINGKVFDSSIESGPATFGVTQVIKGWQEALKLMPVGSKWKVYIPHELAYGKRNVGNGLIPPYSALIFEMELLEIVGS